MPRKAVDSRIPALIRNGVQDNKRSFVVVVGDRVKEVICHLHYLMSSVDIKQNRSVLWAYKKDLLGFTRYGGLSNCIIVKLKFPQSSKEAGEQDQKRDQTRYSRAQHGRPFRVVRIPSQHSLCVLQGDR